MDLNKKVIIKATGEVSYLENEFTVEGTKYFELINDSTAYEESELLFIKSETEGTEKKVFSEVELSPSEESTKESEHGNVVDDYEDINVDDTLLKQSITPASDIPLTVKAIQQLDELRETLILIEKGKN